MNYKLPFFGNIQLEDLNEYYETELEFESRKIRLDLNFEDTKMEIEVAKAIENYIENIKILDKQNKEFYFKDFKNNGEAKSHVEFYFEEFEDEEEELKKIINTDQSIDLQMLEFLEKFELIRIGLYPPSQIIDKNHEFGIFDYSIKIDDWGYSNQLLVIRVNSVGKPIEVDWES